jgi:hypothetical protein
VNVASSVAYKSRRRIIPTTAFDFQKARPSRTTPLLEDPDRAAAVNDF